MNIKTVDLSYATLIHFWLPKGEILQSEDLRKLNPPVVTCDRGVIISGRLPVWFFVSVSRFYINNPWIATFDPRLGAVVCDVSDFSSHPTSGSPLMIGDIILLAFPAEDLPC